MRALILVTFAMLAVSACKSGDREQAQAKEGKLVSGENRVLDPGGAMSDPNARALIAGNTVADPTTDSPKPKSENRVDQKTRQEPRSNPHKGH